MTTATRRMATQELGIDRFIERDGQGKPSYQADTAINGRVQRIDDVVNRGDGTEIATQYTVWVDAGQTYLPLHHDRLTFATLGEFRTAIVVDRYEGKSLNGVIRHVRLKCREE